MKFLIHPGDRVIAKTNAQGLQRGRTYQVTDSRLEISDVVKCGAEVVTYKLTTWPERDPKEIIVRSGIAHLRLASGWTLL